MSTAVVMLAVIGCYHATIETGATPSTQVVSKEWAAGWIYGLVPPSTVSTAEKCPGGVAKVETQLSFPNMLVGMLTFGIFTPMSIVATCAEGRRADASEVRPDIGVSDAQGAEAIRAAFKAAADQAVADHKAVVVHVRQ